MPPNNFLKTAFHFLRSADGLLSMQLVFARKLTFWLVQFLGRAPRGALESLRDGRRRDGYVIPRRRDQRITSSGSTSTLMAKMRKHSGIPDFDFHSLRHTASTIMVSQALGHGVGLAGIQKILGHSKVETTMKYIHADFDRMKKAVEILEEMSIMNKAKDDEKSIAQD
jgi:integrase